MPKPAVKSSWSQPRRHRRGNIGYTTKAYRFDDQGDDVTGFGDRTTSEPTACGAAMGGVPKIKTGPPCKRIGLVVSNAEKFLD
jgi:hypothetical protein